MVNGHGMTWSDDDGRHMVSVTHTRSHRLNSSQAVEVPAAIGRTRRTPPLLGENIAFSCIFF